MKQAPVEKTQTRYMACIVAKGAGTEVKVFCSQ